MDKTRKSDRFLILEAYTEIEEFDSLLEGSANIRSQILAALGLFTFLTGEVFSIYDFHSQQSFEIKNAPKQIEKNNFVLNGTKDEALRAKCRLIVITAYKNNYPESRARDYLKNFEYHNFKFEWFKEFVGIYLNN